MFLPYVELILPLYLDLDPEVPLRTSLASLCTMSSGTLATAEFHKIVYKFRYIETRQGFSIKVYQGSFTSEASAGPRTVLLLLSSFLCDAI